MLKTRLYSSVSSAFAVAEVGTAEKRGDVLLEMARDRGIIGHDGGG